MNRPADQSSVLLKRNKHAAAVQRCTPPLSLETEEMRCVYSHTKVKIKSPNATQNIARPTPMVPI